jgi:polyphosphate kinase
MTTSKSEPSVSAEQPDSALDLRLPSKEFLLNRDLSLLEFHRRVLEEALDREQPLFERLKFLSIFTSNIDEFFMIRVSALKEQLAEGVSELSPDGMTVSEQLKAIREQMLGMVAEQMRCLNEDLMPKLEAEGIEIVHYEELSEAERESLTEYFMEQVFPVLTPQAVDPGHPFPYISNLSLNLGLMVEPVPEHGVTRSLHGKAEPRFARIKLPRLVPRLIPVSKGSSKFTFLGELITANINTLFPRMHVGEPYLFRVTRDADVEIRDEEAHDLLSQMQQTLRKRHFGSAVRLEVSTAMPRQMVDFLTKSLELTPEDVYVIEGPLHVPDLMRLYKLPRPELKDKPLQVTIPAVLKNADSVFDVIAHQDVLVHHPYNSYSTVTDFIDEAARDKNVMAIKMCLYRTGQDSPIPRSLIEACERGKQVTVLVELKARFDEEANIEWAKKLEEAGVHVVYGLLGLKTHCKVALVIRREDESLKRYVHIATGNYNPATSAFYTDLGLLTSNKDICSDASDLFNYLTGFSRQKVYRQLLVAPANLRERMTAMIEREAEHARQGRPARIIAKLNRIADVDIIRALYEASRAGVEMDLIVRGVCMLRPGVPGLSETIKVRSIVGRFLEHSRAFYFENGGQEELYMGSSDWMPRNLNRRVEVVTPIHDPALKRYLKDELLAAYLRDNVKARELMPDGRYERVRPAPGEEEFSAQMYFENAAIVASDLS